MEQHQYQDDYDEDDGAAGLIRHELKILGVCIPLFIFLDFLLLSMHLHNGIVSSLVFACVIGSSVYYDIVKGPKSVHLIDLQRRMFALAYMILFFLIFIFTCACLTNQFWTPIQIEFEEEPGVLSDDDPLFMWQLMYKGFRAVRLSKVSYFDEGDDFDFDEDMGGIAYEPEKHGPFSEFISTMFPNIDVTATMINAVIHAVVGATKITIARFLILEGENTVKMLILFYTTL